MSTFYAYISVGEISAKHDPVRALRTAGTVAELDNNKSYDPDHTSLWPLADVGALVKGPIPIQNLKTGTSEPANIYTMVTL